MTGLRLIVCRRCGTLRGFPQRIIDEGVPKCPGCDHDDFLLSGTTIGFYEPGGPGPHVGVNIG